MLINPSYLCFVSKCIINNNREWFQIAGETGKIIFSDSTGKVQVQLDDTEKSNKQIILNKDWVVIIPGNALVNKGMAKLKSKIISLLVEAAESGDLHIVKSLVLKHQVEIDAKNASGRTAFQAACLNGHQEIIKWLLSTREEIDLEQEDDKGRRALHLAAKGYYK